MIVEVPNKNIIIKGVKVDNDKLIDVPKPLPGWNYFMYVVGGPGSGKTTMIINLLKKYYKKKYDRVYLFTGSLGTLPEKFLNKFNENRIYTDLDDLQNIINEIKENKDKPKILMVFDDMVRQINENKNIFIELGYNRRHIGGGVSLMMITQKLNKIDLSIRTAADAIFYFNLGNKRENNSLYNDYITNMDETKFNEIIEYIRKNGGSHPFLYIDKKNFNYYKNFNKLLIE